VKKVIVAMSGGVDSSISAALLKKQGFFVIGAYMILSDLKESREAKKRAKQVAKLLNIPFLIWDLRKEFKRIIIKGFLKEYQAGKTPNPCVICNKEIKFGLFLKKALSLKSDYIATGHYARIKKNKIVRLYQGKDKEKDQSYFLWQLNQKQLKKVIFPLGGYTKKEVKEIARKLDLPVFDQKESQEICFISKTTEQFLKKNLKLKPGKIIDEGGEEIGEHQGLALYTIGQRKGIRLSGGPYYVLLKDLKNNYLVVTKKEKDLYRKQLIAKNINWVSSIKPKMPIGVKVKIRYRHKSVPATVSFKKGRYLVVFKKPERAVTSGQSVVFYKKQELLGGGIIC